MKKYCWKNNEVIEKTEQNRFLVRNTRNEAISLNNLQYEFLLNFSNKYISVNEIQGIDIDMSNKFIDYLVNKKILVEDGEHIGTKIKNNPLLYIKKLMFISVPSNIHKKLENNIEIISQKVNIVFISKMAVILNLLSIPITVYLFRALNFSIADSPRTILTFFIGFLAALVHEFWIAVYIKKRNLGINRWFVKLVIGVFISIGTNWSSMLQRSKKERIFMFIFSINLTFLLASIELFISVLFFKVGQIEISRMLFIFSLGTQIFVGISLYPFLFKNDGYFIFQELVGVYKIRSKALSILFIPFSKNKYIEWKSYKIKEKILISLWLLLFILSIFVIEFLVSNAIRIII